MSATLQTDRTTVRRLPQRGAYDRDTVYAILDEALICHVGFVSDAGLPGVGSSMSGNPVVIPTIHWREGDTLYFHGSAAAGFLRSLRTGAAACVTVTLLDGLVLARSAFHHSMNYRSAVILGKAREVTGTEKLAALTSLVEHVCAGRSRDARPANDVEFKQTLVLAIPIDEASAKIRTGGPLDDEADYALDIWAGVLPLALVPQAPITDGRVEAGVPEYVTSYRRPTR
jgi:nitroimidazol reductase NimA-like FMN-containing flavoprotein (pyridoxamine 5'-phosphate oxidase superfamily)